MLLKLGMLLSLSIMMCAADGDQTMELKPWEQQLMRICTDPINPIQNSSEDLLKKAHSKLDTIELLLQRIENKILPAHVVGTQALKNQNMPSDHKTFINPDIFPFDDAIMGYY